ncbi:MAG: hypothetical protein F6K24_19285 [Okeania sp. SIO2D1]|nr:hypothetical protein [Okeania sp. SIO2D1]
MTTTYSTLETLLATSLAIFPGVGGVTFWTYHVLNSTTFIITFQQRPDFSSLIDARKDLATIII